MGIFRKSKAPSKAHPAHLHDDYSVSKEISGPSATLSRDQIIKTNLFLVVYLLGLCLTVFYWVYSPNSFARNLFGLVAIITGIAYVLMANRNKKSLLEQGGDSSAARLKTLLLIEHLAGLDDLQLNRAGSVVIAPEGLIFNISKSQHKLIRWGDIEHVEAGSEEQLRNRVTLSRVLLTGIFALALKKERKQKFYLTIETVDGVGLWNIISIGRDNRKMQAKALIFSSNCNSRVKAIERKATPEIQNQSTEIFQQIEKLSELLDKKIISKDDFETKKNELLNRL